MPNPTEQPYLNQSDAQPNADVSTQHSADSKLISELLGEKEKLFKYPDEKFNTGFPSKSGAVLPFTSPDGSSVVAFDPHYNGLPDMLRRPNHNDLSSHAVMLSLTTQDGISVNLRYQEGDVPPQVRALKFSRDGESVTLERYGLTDRWLDSRTGEVRQLTVETALGRVPDIDAELAIIDHADPKRSEFYAPKEFDRTNPSDYDHFVRKGKSGPELTMKTAPNAAIDAVVKKSAQIWDTSTERDALLSPEQAEARRALRELQMRAGADSSDGRLVYDFGYRQTVKTVDEVADLAAKAAKNLKDQPADLIVRLNEVEVPLRHDTTSEELSHIWYNGKTTPGRGLPEPRRGMTAERNPESKSTIARVENSSTNTNRPEEFKVLAGPYDDKSMSDIVRFGRSQSLDENLQREFGTPEIVGEHPQKGETSGEGRYVPDPIESKRALMKIVGKSNLELSSVEGRSVFNFGPSANPQEVADLAVKAVNEYPTGSMQVKLNGLEVEVKAGMTASELKAKFNRSGSFIDFTPDKPSIPYTRKKADGTSETLMVQRIDRPTEVKAVGSDLIIGNKGDLLVTEHNGEQYFINAKDFKKDHRPVPADVHTPMGEFMKTAKVKAEISSEAFTWTDWQGKEMRANAGDWKVTQPDGKISSVTPEIFKDTYASTGNGEYVKTAITRMQELNRDITVNTLEGPQKGNKGDMLVTGPEGEQYVVPRKFFDDNYKDAKVWHAEQAAAREAALRSAPANELNTDSAVAGLGKPRNPNAVNEFTVTTEKGQVKVDLAQLTQIEDMTKKLVGKDDAKAKQITEDLHLARQPITDSNREHVMAARVRITGLLGITMLIAAGAPIVIGNFGQHQQNNFEPARR